MARFGRGWGLQEAEGGERYSGQVTENRRGRRGVRLSLFLSVTLSLSVSVSLSLPPSLPLCK